MMYVLGIIGLIILAISVRISMITNRFRWMLDDQKIVSLKWVASEEDSRLAERIIAYAYEGGVRPSIPSDHPRATDIASSMMMADKWHAIIRESDKSFWQRIFGL